jgi:hypothetical protein
MLSAERFVVGRGAAPVLLPVAERSSVVYSRGRIRGCAPEPMTTPAGAAIVRL